MYTGYWTGYAYRPGGEGTLKPVVICPYVMVPADTAGLEDIPNGQCGMTEGEVHPALERYLTDGNGNMKDCQILLDDGVLDPMPNPF